MKDLFGNKMPVQIEMGEWWFNGRIIQEQNHPALSRYISFPDNEADYMVSTHSTMKEAIEHCLKTPCEKPDHLPEYYIGCRKPLTDEPEKEVTTIGELISSRIKQKGWSPDGAGELSGLAKGSIHAIMNDEVYPNSIPVLTMAQLLMMLDIWYSEIEPCFMPTFNLLKSKETLGSIKKKPRGHLLWENEESLHKYMETLKKSMPSKVRPVIKAKAVKTEAPKGDPLEELLLQSERALSWMTSLTDWAGGNELDPPVEGLKQAIETAKSSLKKVYAIIS